MTRRRFYAPPEAFEENFVTLATEEARHLRDVLRLRVGDEAFVFDGEGREYLCHITESLRSSARLEVREAVEPASPESPLSLTLAVALLKGEKFDLVVQKATELGVTRILPVITKRADVRPREQGEPLRRGARWQRLALEACKQSGRARLLEIVEPISFTALLKDDAIENAGARLMFAERSGQSLAEIFNRSDARPSALTALVGSEGGWEDEEISQAADSGWTIVTLGGRILRAETAAITVAALLQHLFGDLK
jgi:16S rRNA (uracil1498-N3)-methyltransferase